MKKELLMASALASTLGAASVAQAVTSTMSGHHRVGVEFDSPNGTAVDTNAVIEQSSFAVSLSEVTDGGTTISSSFNLVNESGGLSNATALTLEFTDGSKLDIFNAGNASGTHDISIPGSAGEEGAARRWGLGALVTGSFLRGVSFCVLAGGVFFAQFDEAFQ